MFDKKKILSLKYYFYDNKTNDFPWRHFKMNINIKP